MYFKLPIEQHQQRSLPANEPWSSSYWPEEYLVPSPNTSNIEDESYNAILANLDEHKGEPTSLPLSIRKRKAFHLLTFYLMV
jgi:hypothetical protein